MVDPFPSDNPFSKELKDHFEEQGRLSLIAWHKQRLSLLCPNTADPVPSVAWLHDELISLNDAPDYLDVAKKLRERMLERMRP